MDTTLKNDILFFDSNKSQDIIQRSCKILEKISNIDPNILGSGPILEIAEKVKIFADKHNCVIQSWVRNNEAFAECYNAEKYDEEVNNTYGLISAPSEAEAVIIAFLWLYERDYFTNSTLLFIKETVG